MAAGGDARRQAGGTEQPAERRLWRKFRVVSERPQLAGQRLCGRSSAGNTDAEASFRQRQHDLHTQAPA
jgi:hypothetical protein